MNYTKIVISYDRFGYDISAIENNMKIHSAWAETKNDAYRKARILADYYKDENGQSADIEKPEEFKVKDDDYC